MIFKKKFFFGKESNEKEDLHRQGLIELYEDQLQKKTESKFMIMVLIEAIRKLKESNSKPNKVESWIVDLEKLWRKTKF